MPKRTNIRLLFTAALVFGFASLSPAEEFIIVNGLPCGTLCRAWMGIKLPPPHNEPATVQPPEAPRADVESPKPRHEHRKAQKPKMARRKVERRETELAEHRPDSRAERRERSSDIAHGAKSPTDLNATGAVLGSTVPEPPRAPSASPAATPEVSVAAPEAKSQPKVDSAAPSPAPTPEVSVAAPDAKSQSAVDSAVPSPAAAPEVTLAAPEAKSQPQVDSAAPTAAANAPIPTPSPSVSPEAPEKSVAAAPNGGEAAPPSPAASEDAAVKPEIASSANPTVTATPTPAETPERSADAAIRPAEAPTPAPSASAAAEPAKTVHEDNTGSATADAAAADKAPATGQGAPEVATLGDAAKPPMAPATAPATAGSANDPATTSEPKVGSLSGGSEAPSGPQMLVVLAKPEVKSAADLNYKTILVAGVTSVSGEQLKASIAVAGAGGAQLKQGDKSDIDELPRGEVAAAIVAVATPGKAADFQEIPGFHALYIEVLPYVGR